MLVDKPNGDGVSVDEMVWNMKQESASCYLHSNLAGYSSVMLIFNLSATCYLFSDMVLLVTGALVFFLAVCLLTAYNNKHNLIKIQIWPCLPSPQYLKHADSFYLLMG